MQITQSKLIGMIDHDGVCIWNIKPCFNDIRTNQYIMFLIDKFKKRLFQLIRFHLPVCHGHIDTRADPPDQFGDLRKCFYPVVHKKHLPSPVDLVIDSITYKLFIEYTPFCMDGLPVWWWSANDRQIACRHQGKL